MIYDNWPRATMVIINLPRHLWKGQLLECIYIALLWDPIVSQRCSEMNHTVWISYFVPLKPHAAGRSQVSFPLFVFLPSNFPPPSFTPSYAYLCTLFLLRPYPLRLRWPGGPRLWREWKRDGDEGFTEQRWLFLSSPGLCDGLAAPNRPMALISCAAAAL